MQATPDNGQRMEISTAPATPLESRSCPFEEDPLTHGQALQVEVLRPARIRVRFPGQTYKEHTLFYFVTPLCRHGYRDVGYHIAPHLMCLLSCYWKRNREVDDGNDKKDASYYLVLTHFVGRELDVVDY
jgi:hypothetical protein